MSRMVAVQALVTTAISITDVEDVGMHNDNALQLPS